VNCADSLPAHAVPHSGGAQPAQPHPLHILLMDSIFTSMARSTPQARAGSTLQLGQLPEVSVM
jgi:hypothetical protein